MAGEITSIELLLTRGRALGICFLIAEQVPSEISRAARISAHLVAAFCTSGTELRAAADQLGIRDPKGFQQLQTLGKGECIVALTGNRCPTPLRLKLPTPAIDRRSLSRQEMELYMARSLTDILPDVKPRFPGFIEQRQEVKQRERDPNRLSHNAWRVFVRIASNPDETIEDRYAALGLNRAEEETARKEGAVKGYLCDAGTLGHNIKFVELTPKGRAFADQHNVPVRTFKSGVAHEYLLGRVRRALSKACPPLRWTSPSGATGTLQPDAYGLFSDGRAICVEINCKNKTAYEVNKLADLCAIDHVDIVLLVTPTKKAVEAMELAITKGWRTSVPRRYVLLSATECLAEDYDWIRILERPS